MNEPTEHPHDLPQRRHYEYEDPQFHDDDGEAALTEEGEPRAPRPPQRRKPLRKLPPRRHYED